MASLTGAFPKGLALEIDTGLYRHVASAMKDKQDDGNAWLLLMVFFSRLILFIRAVIYSVS